MAHWNGRDLRVTHALPSTAARGGTLTGVAASAPNDVWAVGATKKHPLVVRWNGRRWQYVAIPKLSRDVGLTEVAAFSANDVWVAGSVGTPPSKLDPGDQQGLLMHWNGRTWGAWQIGDPPSYLSAIDGTSSRDLWAVGGDPSGNLLVVHWNGRTWRQTWERPLARAHVVMLGSVDARSPSDVWVTASDNNLSDVLLHWNGNRLATYTRSGQPGVEAVAAVSSREAWAVGGRFDPDRPLVVHWNGTSWQTAKTALDDLRGTNLSGGLSANSPRDIWAVGDHLVARYSC